MTKIAESIAAINTRTMGNRRIEQAKARLASAEEALQFERELIAALEAHVQTMPEARPAFIRCPPWSFPAQPILAQRDSATALWASS